MFWLAALVVSADPVAVALDFGSYFVKSSVVRGREIPEIGLNAQSKRLTPAFAAFHSRPKFNASLTTPISDDEAGLLQPGIGDRAIGHLNIRPFMGTGFFSALTGLNDKSFEKKAKELFVMRDGARVKHNDLMGLFIKSYVQSVAGGSPVSHLTMVFPASWTTYQRRIVGEAVEACGYDNYTEMDDVDAVALTFAIEKVARFKDKKNVLFVDVGATSVKAYVLSFEVTERGPVVHRLSYADDRWNGGAFVTGQMVELLKVKIGVSETTDSESRRLFMAAEKAKNELTILKKVNVLVEEIKGIDRSFEVDRDEFEKAFIIDKLASVVVNVTRRATEKVSFDEMELIGGSSRIPLVQEILKKELKLKNIGHSLNGDEAIAFGAGYKTQYVLNSTKFKPVEIINDAQMFEVRVVAQGETMTVCTRNQPCVDNVTVNGLNLEMSIEYRAGPYDSGLITTVEHYRVSKNMGGKLTFKFDTQPLRFIGVEKCNDTCVEGRHKPKTAPFVHPGLINLLLDSDARIERLGHLKNEVEQLSIRVLDDVAKNMTVRHFSNHSQRLEMIRCAEREKKWVRSSEAESAVDPVTFSDHLRELKMCVGTVYRRIEENRTFYLVAGDIYSVIQTSKHLLKKWHDEEYPVDPARVFQFKQKVEIWDNWFNATVNQTLSQKPYEFFKTSVREMREKLVLWRSEMESIQTLYGGAGVPTFMRRDGTPATPDEVSGLDNGLLSRMRTLNKYDPETGAKRPSAYSSEEEEDL